MWEGDATGAGVRVPNLPVKRVSDLSAAEEGLDEEKYGARSKVRTGCRGQRSVSTQPGAPNSALVPFIARERALPVTNPGTATNESEARIRSASDGALSAPVSQLRLAILARRNEQVVRVPRGRWQERREMDRGNWARVAAGTRTRVSAGRLD